MINPTQSSMQMPPPPPRDGREQQSLTDEQKTLISDTLAQYDAENLTESDAQSIIAAFSEAGIHPSREMEEAMSELGFEAREIGELAGFDGRQGPPPPPPSGNQQSDEQISQLVDYLSEAIEEKLSGTDVTELSDEDKAQILADAQQKFGLKQTDSIIDTTA